MKTSAERNDDHRSHPQPTRTGTSRRDALLSFIDFATQNLLPQLSPERRLTLAGVIPLLKTFIRLGLRDDTVIEELLVYLRRFADDDAFAAEVRAAARAFLDEHFPAGDSPSTQ